MDKIIPKHTFAVCAYKESPYLRECIESLVNQEKKSDVIVCTSTPCEYIYKVAKEYELPIYIRDGQSDIRDDWNFAYNMADADFVTIAHQDDIYCKDYVSQMFDTLRVYRDLEQVIIYFTDYLPLKETTDTKRDLNSKIRRLLRTPLKWNIMSQNKMVRRMTLALGNSICCPTVTYNKRKLGKDIFTSVYKFNIDWDTFYKLAGQEGVFAYKDKPLVLYRVHDGATSKEFIDNHLRIEEDTQMFNQFWPVCVSKLIMLFYQKAYDTYDK